MRILVLAVLALFASQATVAGHHEESLKLAKRQADTTMTVTSINLGDNGTTITATGDMGEYGKVYTTYNLTRDADGVSGQSNDARYPWVVKITRSLPETSLSIGTEKVQY